MMPMIRRGNSEVPFWVGQLVKIFVWVTDVKATEFSTLFRFVVDCYRFSMNGDKTK